MNPLDQALAKAVDLGLFVEASFRMTVVVCGGILAVWAVSSFFRRWEP